MSLNSLNIKPNSSKDVITEPKCILLGDLRYMCLSMREEHKRSVFTIQSGHAMLRWGKTPLKYCYISQSLAQL